jgi:DNA-binding CsgD family transcriptional regulator
MKEAHAELQRAFDVFCRIGAKLAEEEAREKAREHGWKLKRPGTTTPGANVSLTPTEVKVARLVAEGRTNPQIGKLLGMSPRTASTHVTNIFTKLGLHSRVELAQWVRENLP